MTNSSIVVFRSHAERACTLACCLLGITACSHAPASSDDGAEGGDNNRMPLGGAASTGAGGTQSPANVVSDAGTPSVDAGDAHGGSTSGQVDGGDVDSPPGGSDAGPRNEAGCGLCEYYAAPVAVGAVEPAALDALSGLAVSRTLPEILYAHNDHDRPVVYALDQQGKLHARITLQDAPASDIEDIAVGPCGTDSCVYLADIGDNPAARSEYAILRFIEPSVPATPGSTDFTPSFTRYRFRYEDGSHNAEGLMVTPDGTVYVVTKLASGSGGAVAASGPSSIYRLGPELDETQIAVASYVATLPIPAADDLAASAAAAHPCGLAFAVRTYDRIYEFRAPADATFEAAFQQTPQLVAMPNEPQSEGIDYNAGGFGLLTSGEGAGATIQLTACQ